MEQLFSLFASYLTGLDWSYVITFILLAYLLNYRKTTDVFTRVFRLKIQTRYRTSLVGILYGTFVYYARCYTLDKAEALIGSFVFAMVFHKLLLERLEQYLTGKQSQVSDTSGKDFSDKS